MNDQAGRSKQREDRFRISSGWPLLLVAAVILSVSNGRWIVPVATWLAPVLLLRFLRTSRKLWKGLSALWLVFFATAPIAWLGLWPFPLPVMAKLVAMGALIALVPYFLDRWSRDHFRGIVQTLVFPASAVAIEFLGSLRSNSTWANVAYTQTDNLPLLQVASIAGIWGITFLMLWLAPVVNNLWQEGWRHGKGRAGVLTYATVLGLVLIYGSSRLIFFAPAGETFRFASVTPPEIVDFSSPEDRQLLQDFQQIMMKREIEDEKVLVVRDRFGAIYGPLFEATRKEARAGAHLVVWPEASLISFEESQDRVLIEQGKQLASEEGIYLGFSIAMIPVDSGRLNENRLLLISPRGEILQTYWKHRTVPVVEEPFAVPGSEILFAQRTPFGTLGGVICYDMDSPRFLRNAGEQRIDVLMAPSGDWPSIKEIHARMAIMRAVEQGFSLVRPANHGLTLAADYQGRVLARMDHFTTSQRQMSAWVPQQGIRTLYTRIGDALPWTCLVLTGLFLFRLVWLTTIARRPTSQQTPVRLRPPITRS